MLQIPDSYKFHFPSLRQFPKPGSAHHGSVLPHNLTAKAAFLQAGQPAQIHNCLCVPVSFKNAVRPCQKGKHMARPAEILRFCIILHTFHCRNGTLGSGNPCCCSDMINGYRKCRLVIVGILFSHLWDFQLSDIGLRHWHTDQAPAMGRHKINIGCGGKFRSTDKVPLIFAFRIIRHQYYFSLLKLFESFFHRIKFKHSLCLLKLF